MFSNRSLRRLLCNAVLSLFVYVYLSPRRDLYGLFSIFFPSIVCREDDGDSPFENGFKAASLEFLIFFSRSARYNTYTHMCLYLYIFLEYVCIHIINTLDAVWIIFRVIITGFFYTTTTTTTRLLLRWFFSLSLSDSLLFYRIITHRDTQVLYIYRGLPKLRAAGLNNAGTLRVYTA